MPRLNTGVQGSRVVTAVKPLDRLSDGTQGSPVFVGAAIVGARKSPGTQGSALIFTWYVDTVDGDDNDSGTTPTEPVKNWGSLSGKGLKRGHTVKVKKGSVVPVATMYADDLIIDAYGTTGDPPVIESIDENGFTAPTVTADVEQAAPTGFSSGFSSGFGA